MSILVHKKVSQITIIHCNCVRRVYSSYNYTHFENDNERQSSSQHLPFSIVFARIEIRTVSLVSTRFWFIIYRHVFQSPVIIFGHVSFYVHMRTKIRLTTILHFGNRSIAIKNNIITFVYVYFGRRTECSRIRDSPTHVEPDSFPFPG